VCIRSNKHNTEKIRILMYNSMRTYACILFTFNLDTFISLLFYLTIIQIALHKLQEMCSLITDKVSVFKIDEDDRVLIVNHGRWRRRSSLLTMQQPPLIRNTCWKVG